MEHNKFNYFNDIVRPLIYFLKVNSIFRSSKSKSVYDKEYLEKL